VSSASAQGDRSHQEDYLVREWITLPGGSGWLLGVFDGHRGASTSELASLAFIGLFEKYFRAQPGDVQAALLAAFEALDEMTRDHRSGSTASVVFIQEDSGTVTLAVLGDSPVAVLDGQGKIHNGPDHNIRRNLEERSAAEARGGIYAGGYLEDAQSPGVGLQMTRALGDFELSRVLVRQPEIKKIDLGEKGLVIVGTDGLLSPEAGSNAEQMTKLLDLVQKGAAAKALVDDALARHTGDNVTAIVWRSDQGLG